MIPMIASLGELRAVRALFERAIADVDARGLARAGHVPLGMMVEVPSAALMAEEFAREAEFFSIGTNDLVQYALAVDRSSPELAYLASFFEPSVLRMVAAVVEAGRRHDRAVALCGAMASDPLAAGLLVGLGLRELSMEASAIAGVREAIGAVGLTESQEAAREALFALTANDVEHLLSERFAERIAVE
jgi:phosphotransferase system enzyme I (PtsI)